MPNEDLVKLKNVYTMKIKGHTVTENHFLREHTPLTLFTLLTLFKRFTLLALALCMNTPNITAWIIRSWKI